MEPIVMAAVIAATPVTVGLVGGMGRYIVSLILDAYKRQAEATMAAKDAEIHMLDRMLAEERAEVKRLQEVTADLRSVLRALGEWSGDGSGATPRGGSITTGCTGCDGAK